MVEKAKIITPLASWIRVNKDGEMRYFAEADWPRFAAEYADNDPTGISGIGVYDTGVSSSYAIALFGDHNEAEKFKLPSSKKEATDGEKIARTNEVSSETLKKNDAEKKDEGAENVKDNPDAKKATSDKLFGKNSA